MENPTKKATVKATGQTITVYKAKNGKWIDYRDCTTEYSESELKFLD